jgi:hypothetical protein
MTACCTPSPFAVRRGIVSLVVCSVLGGAAFFRGDAAAPPALDPALLFPSGTVLTLSFDGGPCAEHSKDLALSKIWHEPEVQEFVKEPLGMLHEQLDTNVGQMSKQLGLTEDELHGLLKTRIALGLTRFEMPEGGMGEPSLDLMLAVDLRGQQKAMTAILKMLEKQLESMEMNPVDSTVAGIPARKLPTKGGAPFDGVTYLFHDGWLIAATSVPQLEAALGRAKSGEAAGSLASDTPYAAAMKEIARPKTVFSAYMNYGFVLEKVGEVQPEVKAMMASAGLGSMRSIGFGVDLDGPSIRERIWVGMAPDGPLQKLMAPIDLNGVLARIPKRSFAAFAQGINPKEYFNYFTRLAGDLPAGTEDLDQVLAEVDKFLGANWREDLLPNLGPEFAGFAALPQYGVVPDVGVLIKVGDRSKIEAALAKIMDRPKAKATHRTVKAGDVVVHYLDLGVLEIDPDFNMRPAYAFVDDYLLVSLAPHSAKNIIASMGLKDGGLAAREDFARSFGRLKAESPGAGSAAIGYVDAQWLAGFLLDSAIPIAQSAVPADELESAKLDLGMIPSTQAITKHLSAILFQAQMKEGGIYEEVVSPTGFLGGVVALGAVGAMVPRVDRDHEMPPPDMEPAESRPVKDEDR